MCVGSVHLPLRTGVRRPGPRVPAANLCSAVPTECRKPHCLPLGISVASLDQREAGLWPVCPVSRGFQKRTEPPHERRDSSNVTLMGLRTEGTNSLPGAAGEVLRGCITHHEHGRLRNAAHVGALLNALPQLLPVHR